MKHPGQKTWTLIALNVDMSFWWIALIELAVKGGL
jgi:hypothetical protein